MFVLHYVLSVARHIVLVWYCNPNMLFLPILFSSISACFHEQWSFSVEYFKMPIYSVCYSD